MIRKLGIKNTLQRDILPGFISRTRNTLCQGWYNWCQTEACKSTECQQTYQTPWPFHLCTFLPLITPSIHGLCSFDNRSSCPNTPMADNRSDSAFLASTQARISCFSALNTSPLLTIISYSATRSRACNRPAFS